MRNHKIDADTANDFRVIRMDIRNFRIDLVVRSIMTVSP